MIAKVILYREIILERTYARVFASVCFIILTALGAYVRIPLGFTPVPVTLQTFFVLLCAAVLGKKWAAASMGGYLFLGLAGLPIFAGANLTAAYLFGPTGGYLIGFVASAWIVGELIQRKGKNNFWQTLLAMTFGCLAGIYLFGVLGLSLFLQCNLSQALALGFLPFVPGDIIKIISASFIFHKIERRSREIFGPC